MAIHPEIASFEINGHPADNNRFVRVEDVLRNPNEQQGLRLNAHEIIGLITVALVLCFIIYLLITNIVLDPGHIDIKNADIQEMYVKYNINRESISLEANASLRVSFKIKGKIKPSVDLGTFKLTAASSDHSPIISFSSSIYQISGNKEQLLVVKFEPYRIRLPEEKLRGFQKKLEEGKMWIILDVDFKWHLKKKKNLVLPYLPRHTYSFSLCTFVW